eukprot:TRINITY_DN1499_c0_g1_i13.p2 TRINITY_DN1499_c0_g1~~TRINITY_DN1499_c0_g1_i13.p2  ORF type:complete len:106 (-),score=28.62 TRINITY_DN1499_c0_g1_i13:48-365(-)
MCIRDRYLSLNESINLFIQILFKVQLYLKPFHHCQAYYQLSKFFLTQLRSIEFGLSRGKFSALAQTKLDKHPSALDLSLIHISEPTRLLSISYAVFCLKKKKIPQ